MNMNKTISSIVITSILSSLPAISDTINDSNVEESHIHHRYHEVTHRRWTQHSSLCKMPSGALDEKQTPDKIYKFTKSIRTNR